MRKKSIVFFSFFVFMQFSMVLIAQNKAASTNKKGFYLEDQIYAGASYNLLRNKPSSVALRGVSNSLFFGFIRDIPLNENRNFGLGVGLGFARDSYLHNMKIYNEGTDNFVEDFQDFESFTNNNLSIRKIELPFEIRWRKSNIDTYKFFRLYTGVKLSYVFYTKAEYELDGQMKTYKNLGMFNKLQYGLTMSIGHGTWNGYMYYGLNNIFKDVKYNSAYSLNLKSINFGVIFYIM